jgi:hypothetical protein
MKKFFRILAVLLLVLVIVFAGGLIYYNSKYPDIQPAKDFKFEYSAEMLERGKYLAHNVALCMDCHSTRDWSKYSGPIVPGTEGMGGEKFDEMIGIPGVVYTKNITPAALGDWTDGELLRAITSGVNKHGDVLFPIMPYPFYNQMAEEDVKAVIAYVRSLKPIENDVPASSINFPVNMLIKTAPREYVPISSPDRNNPVEYGKYLVNIGACNDCHSPSEDGQMIEGKELSGGYLFDLPFGEIRSANITPDMETGIGSWSKETFLARFRHFLNPESTRPRSDNSQTIMPWTMYAGMTDEDLSAIYDYLRTVKPVKNRVVPFTPPNQKFMNVKR